MRITFTLIILAFFVQITQAGEAKIVKENYYQLQQEYENDSQGIDVWKEKGWKLRTRELWKMSREMDHNGNIQYFENFLSEEQKLKEKYPHRLMSESGWMPVGPDREAISYDTLSGHGIGRVNCIAFHPEDKDIMWIGTPAGGVWKTYDHGANWMPVSSDLPTQRVSHIAIDPNNPDILYMASGDIDGSSFSDGKALGVYKSTDGGLNWELTGLNNDHEDFSFSTIRRILINRGNTDNLLAITRMGIFSSTDAGNTWERTLEMRMSDALVSPKNLKTVFGVSYSNRWYHRGNFVIRSSDFGVTWDTLNVPFDEDDNVRRMAIAISPANPDYIYITGTCSNSSNNDGFGYLYRSTDGGDNWTVQSSYQTVPNIGGWWNGDEFDGGSQGNYDLTLMCDANDPDKIYHGMVNVWASDDGGISWNIVSHWTRIYGSSVHADIHWSDYNPADGYYYFCSDGGIDRTQEIIPGENEWIDWADRANERPYDGFPGYNFESKWERINANLEITQFYRIAISKNHEGFVAGGSQDNSCYYFDDSDWVNYVTNYDGMWTMIDYNDPQVIYGAWQGGGLCRSDDGGKTQHRNITAPIGEGGNWVTPYAMDPVDPQTIYAGYSNLWKSTDKGDTWEMLINVNDYEQDMVNTRRFDMIEISETDPNVILASKMNRRGTVDGEEYIIPSRLYYSKDKGESWELLEIDTLMPYIVINDIEIDDNNSDRFGVCFSSEFEGKMFAFTEDGGENWYFLDKNPPAYTIYAIEHQAGSENDIVYCATEYGVFYTDDTLEDWVPLNENLPRMSVRDLVINYNSQELYCGTYGRGIWKTKLVDFETSVVEKGEISDFELFPNPSNGNFNINFLGLENNYNSIEIIDIKGKVVQKSKLSGSNLERLNADLPTGLYFIKLNNDESYKVKKLYIID
jgi:photosystem II stability/assembly factor-like uncharacterized protein